VRRAAYRGTRRPADHGTLRTTDGGAHRLANGGARVDDTLVRRDAPAPAASRVALDLQGRDGTGHAGGRAATVVVGGAARAAHFDTVGFNRAASAPAASLPAAGPVGGRSAEWR